MGTFAHPARVSGVMRDQPAAGGTDADMVRIAVMFAARAAAAALAAWPLAFPLRHALLHFQKNFSVNLHIMNLCAL